MTASARVLAQAKVNLLLRVLAREASGFHSIETVFLRLDLADRVNIRITESGRTIDCAGPSMPAAGLGSGERNLGYRAAAAYADATGWPRGFTIELEKHIPVGAGLGGGSADAGAVLRALDALSPNPLGHRLAELGGELGSDVPFMTLESPMALAWARGDRLLPLPALAPRPVLLAAPAFAISTADAYGWLAASRGHDAGRTVGAGVIAPESLATWEAIAGIASNDFDAVVSTRFRIIPEIIEQLRQRDAYIAMVSGSGSSVFGVFASVPPTPESEAAPAVQWIATRTAERVVRVELNR